VVDSNDRDRIVEARDELHRMLSEVSHAVMHHFEFGCGVNTEEDVGVDPILWGSLAFQKCVGCLQLANVFRMFMWLEQNMYLFMPSSDADDITVEYWQLVTVICDGGDDLIFSE
jgi:hypothetical protein